MKKPVILNILLIFFCINIYAQSFKQKKIINNKTLSFKVIRTPTKILDSNKVELSQTLIKVYFKKGIEKKIKGLQFEEWISLLSDEDTDWAANLCLYDIYKRDASFLKIDKGRSYWKKCCKENDLAFWKITINNKKPQ